MADEPVLSNLLNGLALATKRIRQEGVKPQEINTFLFGNQSLTCPLRMAANTALVRSLTPKRAKIRPT